MWQQICAAVQMGWLWAGHAAHCKHHCGEMLRHFDLIIMHPYGHSPSFGSQLVARLKRLSAFTFANWGLCNKVQSLLSWFNLCLQVPFMFTSVSTTVTCLRALLLPVKPGRLASQIAAVS